MGKRIYNKNVKLGTAGDYKYEVELTLTAKEKGTALSICGNICTKRGRDVGGGQCHEEIKNAFPDNEKIQKLVAVWERWHLNDLKAGCEHQRALGWDKDGYDKHPSEPCPTCGYKYGTAWLHEELPQEIIVFVKSFEME